jgi:cobalt-zinc-cadmium efflux system membrane fusion protein
MMNDSSQIGAQTASRPLKTTRGMTTRQQWLVVLALSLIASAIVVGGWLAGRASQAPANAPAVDLTGGGAFRPTQAQLVNLKVTSVASVAFRTEQVTEGKIALNSDKSTPVFSPYSGRVTKVLANLGDHVKRGQALLELEASELAQAQNDLVSALNALNTARAQLGVAQTNEQRKHALYDARGGSLQDWQQSQSDLVSAQNSLRSAEAALALARNRLRIQGKTEPEMAKLESPAPANAEAYLLAPISGTVTDRQVGLGQYIQAGAANPVYTIGDLSTVWLVANVRESDAPHVRRGQAVEVRVLALPQQVFKANLIYVAPAIDPNTRRLAVRAEVENPDGALKPEMFATFNIITGGEASAPGVPDRAVVYEGEAARVWVVNSDGTIALRPIHTGRTSHGMVEVTGGLEVGEQVVSSGTLFIDRAARNE